MNTKRPARELALDLLERSSCNVRVAAVLFDSYRGREHIFAWGWNFYGKIGENKNCVSGRNRGMHAEESCLFRANKKRVRGATMVIAGRRKNGNFVYSRPCGAICLPLLKRRGIEKIVFTDRDGSWITMELDYVKTGKRR